MKSICFFLLAASLAGITEWLAILAQGNDSIVDLIQLGGTGGLVVALLGAVIALWRELRIVKADWRDEVEKLRQLLGEERKSHRQEIAQIRGIHKADLESLTQRYTDELKGQIELLRTETEMKIDREREISNKRYQHDDE